MSNIRTARLSKVATREEYYSWLYDLVVRDDYSRGYAELMTILFFKNFRWHVPNDDNRAFEAKNLREQFCEELGVVYNYDHFEEDANMLELLIGLAYRCESIMADQGINMKMVDWFWEMLKNAELDRYTDEICYEGFVDPMEIDDILEKIIQRTYSRDGKGGLFPLKFDKKDQRKVELWYQMSSYLVENYYMDDKIV